MSIALAATILSFSALQADSGNMALSESLGHNGGFVTGFSLSSLPATLGSVNVGYYNQYFLVDVGASYSHISDANITDVIGHLGARPRICTNFFGTVGVMGQGRFVNDDGDNHNNWSVGAFAGLDYQISRHFMISGKVYPYAYRHHFFGNSNTNQVFANGTISFFYVY